MDNSGNGELHNLSKSDININKIKTIYNSNNDLVNHLNKKGQNCLIYSLIEKNNNFLCIKFFIENTKINIDQLDNDKFSAFTYACKNNDIEVAKLLLDNGLSVYNVRTIEDILPINYISNYERMRSIVTRVLMSPNKKKELAPASGKFNIPKDEKFKIFNENLKLTLKSGKGAYGESLLVKDANNKEYVLKKYIKCTSGENKIIETSALSEIYTMKYLNNINNKCCVFLNGISIIKSCTYLVMEPLTYTLVNVAMAYHDLPFDSEKINFIKDVLYILVKNLYYIHSSGIFHSDIKSENIMIDSENYPRFIDFGLSNFFAICLNKNMLEQYICTITTKAPDSMICGEFEFTYNKTEKIRVPSKQVNYTSDVYSLAQVFMELIFFYPYGKTYLTYPNSNFLIYKQYIHEDTSNYQVVSPAVISTLNTHFPKLHDLLLNMCKYDSTTRYNAIDCLKHPFFEDYYKNDSSFSKKEKNEIVYKEDYSDAILTHVKPFFSNFEKYFTSEEYFSKSGVFVYKEQIYEEFKETKFKPILPTDKFYRKFNLAIPFLTCLFKEEYIDLDTLINTLNYYKSHTDYAIDAVYYFYESFFDLYGNLDKRTQTYETSMLMLRDISVFSFVPVKLHIYYYSYKLYELKFTYEFIKYLINHVTKQIFKWYYLCHSKEFPVSQIIKNIILLYLENNSIILNVEFYGGYFEDNEIQTFLKSNCDDSFSEQLNENETTFETYSKIKNMTIPIINANLLNATTVEISRSNLYSLEKIFITDNIPVILNKKYINKRKEYYEYYMLLYNKKMLNRKTENYKNDEYFDKIFMNENFSLSELTLFFDVLPNHINIRNFCINIPIKDEDKQSLFNFLKKNVEFFNVVKDSESLVSKIYSMFFKMEEVSSDRISFNIDAIDYFGIQHDRSLKFMEYLTLDLNYENNKQIIECGKILHFDDTSQFVSFEKYLSIGNVLTKCIILDIIDSLFDYENWFQLLNSQDFAIKSAKFIYLVNYSDLSEDEKEHIYNGIIPFYEIKDVDLKKTDFEDGIEYVSSAKTVNEFFSNIFKYLYENNLLSYVKEAIFYYTSMNNEEISPRSSVMYKLFNELLFTDEFYNKNFNNINWSVKTERNKNIYILSPSTPIVIKNTYKKYNDDENPFPTFED